MARPSVTLTTPRGTFSRQSARPYTHLVVCTGITVAKAAALWDGHVPMYRAQVREYTDHVADLEAGRPPRHYHGRKCYATADDFRGYLAHAQEQLAHYEDRDAMAAHLAGVERGTREWGQAGWSMSLANAQKMANTYLFQYHQAAVEVYEVATGRRVAALGWAMREPAPALPQLTEAGA